MMNRVFETNKKKGEKPFFIYVSILAERLGFEPKAVASETTMLPLHHLSIYCNKKLSHK